jgi:hypothetical protein
VSERGVVWERGGVTTTGQALWANDANIVVVPLSNGSWLVVDLEGVDPVVHSVKVEGIEPPGPPPGQDFVTRPLAFSADGKWVYGEAPANVDPRNRALFRAATGGGRATRIRDLPTEGPGRAISDQFDPATGRTVDPTGFPNGTISSLVVRNADGSKAWEARFQVIVTTAWLGDGRLVVMHSDRFGSPRYLSLVAMSGEGGVKTVAARRRTCRGWGRLRRSRWPCPGGVLHGISRPGAAPRPDESGRRAGGDAPVIGRRARWPPPRRLAGTLGLMAKPPADGSRERRLRLR